jgi:hypothetical protein
MAPCQAQRSFVDAGIGYSITVPDTWRREVRDDSTHSFYDSSAVHGSQIFVTRFRRDPVTFAAPEDWTRAHFVAYKIAVDYSGYPYAGLVLYFDSTHTRKLGDLWAPEIYATYLLADTLNPANPPVAAWSDFAKITSAGGFGYEVYAVGDTADMQRNAGYYDTIMMTVRITPPVNRVRSRTAARIAAAGPSRQMWCDLAGRRAVWVRRQPSVTIVSRTGHVGDARAR